MVSGVKRPLVLLVSAGVVLCPDLFLLLLGRESVELSAIVAGGTSDGVMEGQMLADQDQEGTRKCYAKMMVFTDRNTLFCFHCRPETW